MKITALLLLIAAGVFLSSCSTEFDPNATGSYAEPNILETQSRIQEMHSDALRQEF
ncbi:MAG: hypothetical protein KDN20_03410 [Verrucomicrobiae bacterium]|nr:hypothetical protein [Verrucomicrobiae bacterium]